MTSITFNSLKKKTNIIGIPENTMDLVNGLFLTVNTTEKDFDYASSFEILPKIVCKLYECLGVEAYSLEPKVIAPTSRNIDCILIAGQILGVSSIGLNKSGEKTHIHFWFYNLHSFNLNYQSFCQELKKNLKCIKGISKRNEFSVKLLPCIDPIDAELRQSNHNNQTIADYITKRDYNSLMNYFATKNNKNFIYFY